MGLIIDTLRMRPPPHFALTVLRVFPALILLMFLKSNTTMIVFAVLPLVLTFLKACTGAVLPQYPPLPPFIALEEHFTIAEIAVQNTGTPPWIVQKLLDLDGLRLEEMDQGRVTKQ